MAVLLAPGDTQQLSASQVTCCMFLRSMSVCMYCRSQLLFGMVKLLVNKMAFAD